MLVICNLEFRLDVNLLFLLPGRMHTFSVSHPPQPTYLSLGPSLGLSLILSWGTCPLFATLILPHLTSVLFFKKFSPNYHSSFSLLLLVGNMSKLDYESFLSTLLPKTYFSCWWNHDHQNLRIESSYSTTGCKTYTVFQNKHVRVENLSQGSVFLLLTPTFPSHVNPVHFSPHQYHPSVFFE